MVEGADRPGYRLTTPVSAGPIEPDPATSAAPRILASSGASCSRDAVDTRIVAEVREGRGRLIDSPAEVGGWPALATAEPARDSDQDGLPDAWEKAQGSNPRKPDSASLLADGTTRLEAWLNAAAARCLSAG